MVPASGDYGSIDNSNNCEQHVLQIPKHYTYSLVEREGVGNEGGGGGGVLEEGKQKNARFASKYFLFNCTFFGRTFLTFYPFFFF